MISSLYDCFKHWSAYGSVYLYSDTHFDDKELLTSIKARVNDEQQLHNLKQFCHKNDTLILLGDVGSPKLLNQLKCYKVLIMGNHDQSIEKYKPYFNEIYSGPLMIAPKLLLSHEPIEVSWAKNICGHIHNKNIKLAKNIFCINPDYCNQYSPWNLGELIKQGLLSNIEGIHRDTINKAAERKKNK